MFVRRAAHALVPGRVPRLPTLGSGTMLPHTMPDGVSLDEVRRYQGDEFTGGDNLRLLPESREAPLLVRHEVIGAPDVRASVPLRFDSSPISLRTSGSGAERRAYSWMLIRTARGVPRFSITSERRSFSTRRSNLPKLARARSAETILERSLSLCSKMNSLFQLSELYS